MANNIRAKKLIEKLEKCNTTTDNSSSLTRNQKKRAKWLKKYSSHHLEIKCDNCKRKSVIQMETPKKKNANNQPLNNEQQQNVEIDLKNNTNSRTKNYKKAMKSTTTQNLLSKKPKNETLQTKPTSSMETKSQSKAKKNKKKNVTPTKVISKTQSKNNLLKLAALLKNNPQQNDKDNRNKLDSFLR